MQQEIVVADRTLASTSPEQPLLGEEGRSALAAVATGVLGYAVREMLPRLATCMVASLQDWVSSGMSLRVGAGGSGPGVRGGGGRCRRFRHGR